MTPEQISTYGAGLLALVLLFWFLRGTLGNVLRKQNANANGEESLNQQLHMQIADLYQRNKELTDRYHASMQDAVKLATTHGETIMKTVLEVRREHHESMQRVHTKMEITERKLDACEERDMRCQARLDALEEQMVPLQEAAHGDKR